MLCFSPPPALLLLLLLLNDGCPGLAFCNPGEQYEPGGGCIPDLCYACPENTYQDEVDHFIQTCKPQSTPSCGKGTKLNHVTSMITKLECVDCTSNTYQDLNNYMGTTCVQQPFCGAGMKISADSKIAARTCSACGVNTYQGSTSHRAFHLCIILYCWYTWGS